MNMKNPSRETPVVSRRVCRLLPVGILLTFGVLSPWAGAQSPATKTSEALTVGELRTELTENPIAVDSPNPRLSWKAFSDRNGESLAAFQVQVARSLESLQNDKPDLWDSGRMADGDLNSVIYRGKVLPPGERAYWRVRLWGSGKTESPWSQPVFWGQGVDAASEWGGEWIGATAQRSILGTTDQPVWLFRKEFDVPEKHGRVLLYLASAGFADAWINGKKVGDAELAPALTDLRKHVPYNAYDVTDLLRPGRNVVGVRLGHGYADISSHNVYHWRKSPFAVSPRFLLSLRETNDAGVKVLCASGGDWKMKPSEITFNCVFGGEFIDAGKRTPDWNMPGKETSTDWAPVVALPAPAGQLTSVLLPPARITEEILPRSIKEVKPGVYVADMGVNFTGWIRFKGKGEKGQTVRIFISERLLDDGTIDKTASNPVRDGGPFHELRATFKDDQRDVFEPAFSFQSGQYVQVEGLGYKPEPEDLIGCAVNNDFARKGSFESSSKVINEVFDRWLRVYRNNWIVGVQFDCPQREKTPWQGGVTCTLQAALYSFDAANAHAQIVQNMLDAQKPNGALNANAPIRAPMGDNDFDVWVQGDLWRVPWEHYQFYGDKRVLETSFDGMKKFMTLMLESVPDGFDPVKERALTPPYGDHASVGYFEERDAYMKAIAGGVPREQAASLFRTSHELLAAMGTFAGAETIANIAKVLGHDDDAKNFQDIAERIRKRINESLDRNTGAYAADSQTLQAQALYYDIAPPEDREKVLSFLKKNITETRGGHLSTGPNATRQMFRTLSSEGEGALALRVMEKPGYPGFVDMLEKGTTAFWERWDGKSSLNHAALGGIADWFFADLAGIQPDSEGPGFRRVVFQPDIDCGLQYAKAEFDSTRGKIASDWKIEGKETTYSVTVPVGAEGRVRLPEANGTTIEPPADAKRLPDEDGRAVFHVGSGTYKFKILRAES
jgi:alpha-L-rhamnosidase